MWESSGVPEASAPSRAHFISLLVAALLVGAGMTAYRYTAWTPLQQRYVWSYVWSAMGFGSRGTYRLLEVVDRKGTHLAIDDEVVRVALPSETSFALSEGAVRAGARQLSWVDEAYDHAWLHAWLAHWIYRDQTLVHLVRPPALSALVVFLVSPFASTITALVRSPSRRTRPQRTIATESAQPAHPLPDGTPTVSVSPTRSPDEPATYDRPLSRPRLRPRPFFE